MSHHFSRQGEPIGLLEWAELFENAASRIVRQHWTRGWKVSTVWVGLDLGWAGSEVPLIFETMIFGDPASELDGYQARAPTEEAALDCHWAAIALVLRETGAAMEELRDEPQDEDHRLYAEFWLARTRDLRPGPSPAAEDYDGYPWADAMRWKPGACDPDGECANQQHLAPGDQGVVQEPAGAD